MTCSQVDLTSLFPAMREDRERKEGRRKGEGVREGGRDEVREERREGEKGVNREQEG